MPPAPAVVTIAALHGAGGATIGPLVAERLGVPFLDRAIPAAVAKEAGITEDAVASIDDRPRSRADRLASTITRIANPATAAGGVGEDVILEEQSLRGEIEQFLARAKVTGGVVLGRGGAVVLADIPAALHVYLGGDRDARVARIMEIDGVGRTEADRRVSAHDRARRRYVTEAYGVDGDEPSLYHLMIDAPALGVDGCVDVICAASEVRRKETHAETA